MALMATKPLRYPPDEYWKCWPPNYANNFEPHWAIKIYLDPRGDFDKDSLVPERGPVGDLLSRQEHVDLALCFFDSAVPGWLPRWFPFEYEGHTFSPQERLAWFDELINTECILGWSEEVTWTEKQRDVARALILLLELTESLDLPLPGWLE